MEPLNKQQIDQLRGLLIDRKIILEVQLAENKDQAETVELDQQLMGRVSRIDAIQQQKMAAANRSSQELDLRNITKALQSIEADEYGYCEECGDLIPFERLKIKPEALYCISCQSEVEN